MAKVFKVVSVTSGRSQPPRSAMAGKLPRELVIEYPIGVAVKPKHGRVFAFDNLTDAITFRKGHYECRVHEAQAGKTYPVSTTIVGNIGSLDHILKWWRGLFHYGLSPAPKGTVLCDFIILGKEVW